MFHGETYHLQTRAAWYDSPWQESGVFTSYAEAVAAARRVDPARRHTRLVIRAVSETIVHALQSVALHSDGTVSGR